MRDLILNYLENTCNDPVTIFSNPTFVMFFIYFTFFTTQFYLPTHCKFLNLKCPHSVSFWDQSKDEKQS